MDISGSFMSIPQRLRYEETFCGKFLISKTEEKELTFYLVFRNAPLKQKVLSTWKLWEECSSFGTQRIFTSKTTLKWKGKNRNIEIANVVTSETNNSC